MSTWFADSQQNDLQLDVVHDPDQGRLECLLKVLGDVPSHDACAWINPSHAELTVSR